MGSYKIVMRNQITDPDYFKNEIEVNKKRIAQKGIIFNTLDDIIFYPTQRSFTFKGFFEKQNSKPVFLKIINEASVDLDRMEHVLEKLNSILPKLYYTETIGDYLYFFMDEVSVFEGPQKISLKQFKGILEIIRKLSRSQIFYSDIHFSNFGYLIEKNNSEKLLLIDFTDLFQRNFTALRVHPGYKPPEDSQEVSNATISFIFALFATEILFAENVNERIIRIIMQFKEVHTLRGFNTDNFKEIDEFLFFIFRHILVHETTNMKFKNHGGFKEKEKWAVILAKMLKYSPENRLEITEVRM